MKQLCLALTLTALSLTPALPQKNAGSPFAGRWDLTVKTPKGTYPSWLEFTGTDSAPSIRVVGRVASVHSAENAQVQGSHLTFSTSEYFGKQIPVTWDLTAAGGKITGHQKRSDGVNGAVTGVPAPALKRDPPANWGSPDKLFDGADLKGWQPDAPSKNHWKAENGELVNEAAGANIRSTRKLQDFKLHIEYNCPSDGNSGVYLRGRYEVQVEYEPADHNDKFHGMGSIYGFLAPSKPVSPRPGQWESYDVTLVGRMVTVVRDGVTIIDNQEIPGITGGALDSHEGEPGQIYIQGDHTGGMKYRNITVALPQR